MSDIVIQAERLGKKYRIRHRQPERYTALRDVIAEKAKPLSRLRGAGSHERQSGYIAPSSNLATSGNLWALKDVSFEVQRGDVIGIIGRNGAGKSTLLKILSRITDPSEGRVELHGRVASLLEVGTGFHPELTGRENIFLNGAILGMTRAEIARKFDEIAAFAEVEKFLDTPVKRYSSGMYVRLAFAVAAHLEPEILVVDEVLAVGDAAFQKKCLGKMGEVARGGRAVLFVSHNMAAVQALCSKSMYLADGTVRDIGDVDRLVAEYLGDAYAGSARRFMAPVFIDNALRLRVFQLEPNPVPTGHTAHFRIEFHSSHTVRLTELALLLYTQQGVRIAVLDFRPFGLPATIGAGDCWELHGEINRLPLVEGQYQAGLYINVGSFSGNLLDLASLSVTPRPKAAGCAPYPAVHRGVMELDFTAEASRRVGP
jgi:lipopolysaccharide transport system ATP-binding protein